MDSTRHGGEAWRGGVAGRRGEDAWRGGVAGRRGGEAARTWLEAVAPSSRGHQRVGKPAEARGELPDESVAFAHQQSVQKKVQRAEGGVCLSLSRGGGSGSGSGSGSS